MKYILYFFKNHESGENTSCISLKIMRQEKYMVYFAKNFISERFFLLLNFPQSLVYGFLHLCNDFFCDCIISRFCFGILLGGWNEKFVNINMKMGIAFGLI